MYDLYNYDAVDCQTPDVALGVGRTASSTKVRTPEGGEDTTEKYDSGCIRQEEKRRVGVHPRNGRGGKLQKRITER